MTEIEKNALALVNECAARLGIAALYEAYPYELANALCRAIEQHEAFRQEVSDAVEAALSVFNQLVLDDRGEAALRGARLVFARFIIAKPDPLVEALGELADRNLEARQAADTLRAAIEKRGGKIVWEDK